MSKNALIPAISPDGNLSRYLEQIRQFPMLEASEEYELATSWKDRGDVEAAHKLVTSHLRLVAKIAMGYRGYGLPMADLRRQSGDDACCEKIRTRKGLSPCDLCHVVD